MMEGESSSNKRIANRDHGFTDIMFSWSLDDILNDNLYKHQVEDIELEFQSDNHYFESYVYPLLEETRAQLSSSMEMLFNAPFAEVISLEEAKPLGKNMYDVTISSWNNRFSKNGKEPYKTLPGDVFILADFKPETVEDLQRVGRMWSFVSVAQIPKDEFEDDIMPSYLKVVASKDIKLYEIGQKSLYVVFLTNIIPNRRMWNALHMSRKSEIIKKILRPGNMVEESCDHCYLQSDALSDDKVYVNLSSMLNESQNRAICACLSSICCHHKATIELIWGPPGTGKTNTLGTLLFALVKSKHRVLACAPTNVAVKEVALRVLNMVRESFDRESESLFCSLGEMLLFGNHERLNVGGEIEEIYLDYRVKQLTKCFAPCTGWNYCFTSMIDLLENCVSHYHVFLENELKGKENTDKDEYKGIKGENDSSCSDGSRKSFLEFVRERFIAIALQLRCCISILCTHISRSYLLEHNFQKLVSLYHVLDTFQALLSESNIFFDELEEVFSLPEWSPESFGGAANLLLKKRTECLSSLRILKDSLGQLKMPNFLSEEAIKEFCFQTSLLIFSTASSSYKLHSVSMEPPLDILVIDEAAQLKECESIIPLRLRGINHAILVGDECQLPAMVESNVSNKAGFGRSLFERLSSLNYPKHLLNIQYRMHPAISFFPNLSFYFNQINNAPNVKRRNYEKDFLPWPMFGPYSFINVDGREEYDDAGRSRRNMVEVAIVMKIVKNLFKVWHGSKENLCIGVVSPYSAQVVALQEKLRHIFDDHDGFEVNVKSIDGFQGGEQDIIILSTVRTNSNSSLEFISRRQRCNVALTRARHALWILGNERALTSKENVWRELVLDAKNRQCFFNADEDKDLAKAILTVKKELDQFDDLLDSDSVLFKYSRWKVLFSDNFRKSFGKLRSQRLKKSVLKLLLDLSTGWRPKHKKVGLLCGNSSQILKQFKVEGLYVVCSTDIEKESRYTQVLKIWDVLSLEDIPKLVKRLDAIFRSYTDDFIGRCEEKCLEGNKEVPMSWENCAEIIKFKSLLDNNGKDGELSTCPSDGRSYVENSKVEESLLLMKFYSLSSGVVSHLLSNYGMELDLPFEVTDEERDIIHFPHSTFVLGRSGTGKTTVLTMKLFRQERKHHTLFEGIFNKGNELKENTLESARPVLHQLFVTVSPKLCQAVKHHVTRLTRSIYYGGSIPAESSFAEEDIVDMSLQFKNLPDSFINLPPNSYPLVITFHKFLMMLDGTIGTSYFKRFSELKNFSHSQNLNSRSVSLESFIRRKEVNYDRFASSYWPHFNSQLTKKLDSSRVFTEIISHIKGGIGALDSEDGKLSLDDYVMLSENRGSSLCRQKRELIYDIYQNYEKMKMENGEFDLADIVIDLHNRLRTERYVGDEMRFIYIDEVQDMTMSQISLFKYICPYVDEGFVFSGDTAQTIARGIDFRFQDIRTLFYKKFVLEPGSSMNKIRKEKGKISQIFHLSQNFRTHAGVLKLSQSIIELIYHFFPHSIDVLKPETSLIYGEPPVVLESGERENAIVKIFGNSGNMGGKIVGFGADQVILVRDDNARSSIIEHVGKQALVLTILECKGLEFQDVLLYNFFGSSPLRNRWRLIYGYMENLGMLDSPTKVSYTSFNDSKHNVLCSELKQLYVAVTRTRQRLWICENTEEFSKPMFDYWKRNCLVQTKVLDDSLAQAMKVASSPEEWKSRGIELYHHRNYGMATMCFERAGDSYWERKSKASGLKATASQLRDLNPEDASKILREAAEIFEGIGMAESAAQCFSDLGDHERAGRLYLEKCEEPDLKRAGDCFCLAGRYEIAAEVYARGSFFSDCLSACAKGRMFEIGLGFIEHWKYNNTDSVATSPELDEIEQKFLESCAHHYLVHKDTRSMMNFVKAFHSMDSKRGFLNSNCLFAELLSLEEESGNFMEAANIASKMGDILHEADLLEKAGKFVESSELVIFYVLANSVWSARSKGWPLKAFEQKADILERALSSAQKVSCNYYELVCTEADILNEQSNISLIMTHLSSSHRYESIRGEILCLRKLLDAHFQLNSSKYSWQDGFIVDTMEKMEGMVLKSELSLETLFYSWNSWKDNIVCILRYLSSYRTESVIQRGSHGQFALNYLGVRKQEQNLNLLLPDAFWVRQVNEKLNGCGRQVSISDDILVSAAQGHWCSELLSVGMNVLHNFEALYKFSVNKSHSIFFQARSLMLIYEVSKFLLECSFLTLSHSNLKSLDNFLQLSIQDAFGLVVPVDWQKPLTLNMIFLRGTKFCQDLAEGFIYEIIRRKDRLTYGQIGKVAVMLLGMGRPKKELCERIGRRFDDNPPWKSFIGSLCLNSGQEDCHNNEAREEWQILYNFYGALQDTYNANWTREVDYISPSCFMYLIERLLLLACRSKGLIFATKSSFIEWLIYQDDDAVRNLSLMAQLNPDLRGILKFVECVLAQLLYNQNDTINWIRKSGLNGKEHFALLALRLVVSLCLLQLISGNCSELLVDLLGKSHIREHLPYEFYSVLCKRRKRLSVEVFADAFKKVDNPLVIAKIQGNFPKLECPDAVFVDFTVSQNREDILQVLFPERDASMQVQGGNSAVTAEASSNSSNSETDMPTLKEHFLRALDSLLLATNESNDVQMIKDCVDRCIELLICLTSRNKQQDPTNLGNKDELAALLIMLDGMTLLSCKLRESESMENRVIQELLRSILSKLPIVKQVLESLENENVMGESKTSELQGRESCESKGENSLAFEARNENVSKTSGNGNRKRSKAKKKKSKNKGRK